MHPCGAAELIIDPLPAGAKREGALYPDGVHLKDLKEVRDLLYKMQRPAIAPSVSTIIGPYLVTRAHHPSQFVYPHDW